MNIDTPLFDDDLYINKKQNFVSLFNQAYGDYFNWNGRVVGQTLWRLLVANQGIVTSLAISVTSIGLVALISYYSSEKSYFNWNGLILSFFALMAFSPVIGQTMFWRAGVGNYLMTTVLILFFVLPFYRWSRGQFDSLSKIWFLLPLFAFIAGWSNENTAGGGLLLALLFILIGRFLNRIKTSLRQFIVILAYLLGYAALVLAPGNSIRTHSQMPNWWFMQSTFMHFRNGFVAVSQSLYHGYLLLIILLVLLTITMLILKGWQSIVYSSCFIIAGIASIYALSLAPLGQDGGRSFFGGTVLLIIALVKLLLDLSDNIELKLPRYLIFMMIFFVCVLGMARTTVGTIDAHRANVAIRERYALLSKYSGNSSVVKVPKLSYYPRKKFAVNYQLEELSTTQKDIFPNAGYNIHFDLKGILLD